VLCAFNGRTKNGFLSNQIVIILLQKGNAELPSCDNYVNLHCLYFFTSYSVMS